MAEYLLEIGMEEMPAAYMNGAVSDLKKNAETLFAKERLRYEKLATYTTPRRLVLSVQGLAERQDDLSEEVKGPSMKAAYKDGAIAKPLEGFLRANGFTEADVYTKEMPNGTYVFCKREEKGRMTKDVLADVMADLVLGMKFPKSMRWGSSQLRYLRPIRWVVSLFNDEIVSFSIGELEAGRMSRGHRTLGHEEVEITSAAEYFNTMEKEYVIVDQERRRQMILEQIAAIFEGTDEHYQEDAGLLSEVINLVEYPTALRGSFDDKFLELPDELVITPMKEHQRYFPVLKNDGTLTNGFITVRNGTKDYLDVVRAGNENVLRARLADAEFFWNEDIKKGLEAGEEKLKNIVFQEKLGTIYEKTQRLQIITAAIVDALHGDEELKKDAVTAARCTKMDLVSNVVSEFPELQGLMGEYYYDHEHPEKKNVGQAIREHYMPRFANDALPESVEGSIVSIADKIDTIVGCYYAGIIPTGSQDPYALRRQALGLSNIIIDKKWSLSLKRLIAIACEAYATTGLTFNDAETNATIHQFFEQRMLKIMKDAKMSNDVIQAVMKVGYDDMYDVILRAEALTAFMESDDKAVVKVTLDNSGRAANITEKVTELTVDPALFNADEEKALYDAVSACEEALPALVEAKDYVAVIDRFAALNHVVEKFFEKILVMDDDLAVRQNRLALVKRYSNVLGAYYKLDEVTSA
ncbi:MAG: glycine--tRNA ligase subunit beta [Peptococcaceae bacterium]|nr:glycine--tRNA ligase subunit beta [Peptococcaceae bacterium]